MTSFYITLFIAATSIHILTTNSKRASRFRLRSLQHSNHDLFAHPVEEFQAMARIVVAHTQALPLAMDVAPGAARFMAPW